MIEVAKPTFDEAVERLRRKLEEDAEVRVDEMDAERKAKMLPSPRGWTVLVAMWQPPERTSGGVIKPDQLVDRESVASLIGFVLDIGPDAYKDPVKFPTGPWCEKGDFVMFRAYTGTRFNIHGKPFRLIPDDSVEAVIEDPRGIQRS